MSLTYIKNYIERDLGKYNSYDERNRTNHKRDLFMKTSFLLFITLLFGKVCHLLLQRFGVCN